MVFSCWIGGFIIAGFASDLAHLGGFVRIVLCVLWFCVVFAQAAVLPADIAAMLDKHRLPRADVSIWVQALDANKPLVALNEYYPRNPASVAKVLTTAAGLLRLGANYQWKTSFYVDQKPDENGVLHGNLYVVGGGDPFLVEERLAAMIDDLRDLGLREIRGNIVLDRSLYVLPPEARDRESFDGNQWAPYNAVPDPLMVNFRTVKLMMTPSQNGVRLSLWPNMLNWRLKQQMQLSRGSCAQHYSPMPVVERGADGYATLTVTGQFSLQCGARELTLVMGEAVEQFYYLFRELWYQKGSVLGECGGR